MAAAPWILMAIGAGIIMVGLVIAGLTGGSGSEYIDARMSDREIERRLKKAEGNSIGGWVMLVGWLMVLAGVAWRIVRRFV